MFEKCRVFQRLCSPIYYSWQNIHQKRLPICIWKALVAYWIKLLHQSHLRKSATCSSRNIFNGGISLTPLKPEKQNEKLEMLIADNFNLWSIGSRWRQMSGKTQTSLLTIYVERTRTNISTPIKDMFLTVRMSMN